MSRSSYSIDYVVFATMLLYGALAVLKTFLMGVVTVYFRMKNNAHSSMEDAKQFAPNHPEKHKLMLRPHEDVERVRRAHLNDLENVIPFVILSLLYVGTNPDPITALWHFRVFFAARLVHSIVYVMGIRQPFRGLAFNTGSIIMVSMIYRIIAATYQHL